MCSRMDVLYGYGVTVEPGPAMQTVAEYQRDYNRMLSEQIELLEKNPHAGNKIGVTINVQRPKPFCFQNRPLAPRYTARIAS